MSFERELWNSFFYFLTFYFLQFELFLIFHNFCSFWFVCFTAETPWSWKSVIMVKNENIMLKTAILLLRAKTNRFINSADSHLSFFFFCVCHFVLWQKQIHTKAWLGKFPVKSVYTQDLLKIPEQHMWSSESSVDVEQWQQRRRGSWRPTEWRGSQMDLSLCEATAQSYLCAVSLDSDAEWLGYVRVTTKINCSHGNTFLFF